MNQNILVIRTVWISASERSLSSCPQDVGRIGVVTGRDDFNRSSLVVSAHFGMKICVPSINE
ncbi:hypothetical protein JOD43_002363 [Pullulanibacillus pueri]|uniref:hypothetical protein n=1 Tax=Pullulanibacillus pueri TaxID=1437324 RepID=UPI00166940F6|nr:hypothetical protein [Pullulanibacillus pueri]MBM7682190.1 hypothetical protein [Pullulanibacillus pueri]